MECDLRLAMDEYSQELGGIMSFVAERRAAVSSGWAKDALDDVHSHLRSEKRSTDMAIKLAC